MAAAAVNALASEPNELTPCGGAAGRSMASGSAPAIPNCSPSRRCADLVRAAASSPISPRRAGAATRARSPTAGWTPAAEELPLYYPVTTEMPFADPVYRRELARFLSRTRRRRIAGHLGAGRDVALLSEGDPLFYGSFMHLFVRLKARFAGRGRARRHRHVRLLGRGRRRR